MSTAQITADHCQACGNTVLDPDEGYTACCGEPVVYGGDDCTVRCYHPNAETT